MSDQTDAKHLIQQGIAAYKAYNQQQAIALFRQATERDPNNQLGWLWLAGCSPSTADQRQHLTRVLHINPDTEAGQRAATALAQLDSAEATKPPPPADANEPFVLYLENLPYVQGRTARPDINASVTRMDGASLAALTLFLAMGIGMIIMAGVLIWQNMQFAAQGAEVEAIVLDRFTRENSDGDALYYVRFYFETAGPDGQNQGYTNQHSVSQHIYSTLEPEETTTVQYLPSDPEQSQITGQRNSAGPFLILFGLFWSAMVLPFFLHILRSFRRNWRLFKHGKVLQGAIVACRIYLDSENDTMLGVRYRFGGEGSGIREQVSEAHGLLSNRPQPAQGTPVLVLYDNEKNHQIL